MLYFWLKAIRVVLRGRAHLEWKVVVSGDQQSISDDQYFIDERSTIWGKGEGVVCLWWYYKFSKNKNQLEKWLYTVTHRYTLSNNFLNVGLLMLQTRPMDPFQSLLAVITNFPSTSYYQKVVYPAHSKVKLAPYAFISK